MTNSTDRRRLLWAALVAALTVLLTAVPASAHAGLAGSDPTDGAVLAKAPTQITLTFTEDISAPAYVVVTGPGGQKLATGKTTINGQRVRQRMSDGGPGRYTVAFRVISVDGHPITEELHFRVKAAATASPTPSPSQTQSPSASPESPVGQREQPQSWLAAHRVHIGIGAGLIALAAGLLWLSRRSAE